MMTLREAIKEILSQKNQWMTTKEIADELNRTKLYQKRDGSKISDFQVHGRTRKYPKMFKRDGSKVVLLNSNISSTNPMNNKKVIDENKNSKAAKSEISIPSLFDEIRFKKAGQIDDLVPDEPGIYCLKIKDIIKLPKAFQKEVKNKGHQIIYIGLASQSLKNRMLNQELRAKGHGTFFRSIGATLGYLPPFNSLKDKKNKRNYKFSKSDEQKIISWINENLEVNWITIDEKINETETQLIETYKPIINIDKNPSKFPLLSQLRKKCVDFANGKSVNEE